MGMRGRRTLKSPVCCAVRSVLSDGEWHTFRELVYAARAAVRPEQAARRYLKDIARIRAMRATITPRPALSLERQVELGISRIVSQCLFLHRHERRGRRGWDREIRMPGGEWISERSRGKSRMVEGEKQAGT